MSMPIDVVVRRDVPEGLAGNWPRRSIVPYHFPVVGERLTVTRWGENDAGQLGNGTTTPVSTATYNPVVVVSQKPLPPQ
jgi:hypothetical protein